MKFSKLPSHRSKSGIEEKIYEFSFKLMMKMNSTKTLPVGYKSDSFNLAQSHKNSLLKTKTYKNIQI